MSTHGVRTIQPVVLRRHHESTRIRDVGIIIGTNIRLLKASQDRSLSRKRRVSIRRCRTRTTIARYAISCWSTRFRPTFLNCRWLRRSRCSTF